MIAAVEGVLAQSGPWALVVVFVVVALDSSAFLGVVLPGESIGLIHGDDIAVSTFVSQHKGVAAIRAACAEMQDDAATAAANLPSPDLQLTQVLSGAFNEYIAAAGDCFNGAGGDQTDLSHSAHERVLADAAIARAVARISSVTGKVPPTTTTTQPPPGGGL